MLTSHNSKQRSVAIAAVLGGLSAGFLTGINPFMAIAAFLTIAIVVGFFSNFETVILGLLIIRSSLDVLSGYQIPALLAIGLDALAVLYISVSILTRQTIKTDNFWWFFLGWVVLQGMWIILLPLGELGMGSELIAESLREWIRLFSMVMVYLLVMQLKDKIPPQRLISILFLSLVAPLTAAAMQSFLPSSMVPSLLVWNAGGGLLKNCLALTAP